LVSRFTSLMINFKKEDIVIIFDKDSKQSRFYKMIKINFKNQLQLQMAIIQRDFLYEQKKTYLKMLCISFLCIFVFPLKVFDVI
jgi:hypothetical protein